MTARDGRRRILLVSASHYQPDGSVARVERYWTSGLTLVHLEALTPPDFSCQLVDDFMHEPPLDTDADLVGITAMGMQIGRAYRLADRHRARGLPVVLGGEWVSLNAEQALEHCDAIVRGEAEYAWPELLADFQRGAVIEPKRMTPAIAEQRFWATYRDFFSLRSIRRRFFPPAPRNLKLQMHYLTANLIFRKLQRAGKHPYLY